MDDEELEEYFDPFLKINKLSTNWVQVQIEPIQPHIYTGCLKKKRAIRFCRNPEYIRISEYQNISETADHSFCIFIWN